MSKLMGKGPVIAAVLVVVVAGAAAALMVSSRSAGEVAPQVATAAVTVYKSPTCGCCGKWVEHLEDHGFTVEVVDMPDLRGLKAKHGIGPALASCHTAFIDDYLVEGHVPADLIERLLVERPAVAGLAVPGMPVGSPGMEGPRRAPYEVLAFDAQGNTEVYAIR